MKEPIRYGCGNGEGMFEDKSGHWVTHEDYKELIDAINKAIDDCRGSEEMRDVLIEAINGIDRKEAR